MKNSISRITLAATLVLCALAAAWLASGWSVPVGGLLPTAPTSHAAEPATDVDASSGERTASSDDGTSAGDKPQPSKPPPLQIDKSAPLLLDGPPQKIDKNAPHSMDGPPPLKIDKSAPLLLDQPRARRQKAFAQNEACYVCHENYREESFADYHARAEVGCIKCHGESIAHRGDESNLTPPDIMFPPEEIEKNCKTCHDTHDAPAAKVIALWLEKCQQRVSPKELLCTDCHGEHRMAVRTILWDKRTGKLQRKPDYVGTAESKAE